MYQPQRTNRHQNPQNQALQHRTHAHLPHRSPRNPRPNQVQRRRQSQFPHHVKHMPCARPLRQVTIHHRSQTEQRDKPRPLNPAIRTLHHRRPHRNRHDPQSPRQFHRRADHQRHRAITRRSSHHRTRVMNRQRRPQPKLLLRQMQQPPQRRKNQQPNSIQNKDRPQRNRRLLLIRMNNRRHGRYRAPAANRSPHGNQYRSRLVHPQHSPRQQSGRQRERNTQRRVNESAAPRAQYFVQVHTESQSHHRRLQQIFRRRARLRLPGMRQPQPKNQPERQRHRRRHQSARAQRKPQHE